MRPSVWLIAGPTASGKSALALRLAEAIGAEVVNADSMQLYAGLEVLTAAPGKAERARLPHHLYGVADVQEAWSVGRWLRAVEVVLARLGERGTPAVIVGGTGLYFRALTCGLAEVPAVPPAVRERAAARLEAGGETAFRADLASSDPLSAAQILAGDRQRLLRAWSVLEATGRTLPDWRASTTRPLLASGHHAAVKLEPPRAGLYARCDARLPSMVEAGALEEVAALLRRGLSRELPAMKALGVRELARHLRGEVGLAEAVTAAQTATRHYAKRQLTWFRNQTPDWPPITGGDLDAQWRELQPLLASA